MDGNGLIVVAAPAQKDWLFNDTLSAVPYYRQFLKEPDGSTTIPGNDGRPVGVYHAYDPETHLMSVVRAEPDDVFADLATIRNMSMAVVACPCCSGPCWSSSWCAPS